MRERCRKDFTHPCPFLLEHNHCFLSRRHSFHMYIPTFPPPGPRATPPGPSWAIHGHPGPIGAYRGPGGSCWVMGGYMGLWGGRGADAFYWDGPKKLGPPRFLFLPSPWSSPSLANPAVKCLGAFHSFSISSAVFANSFVTSPSDVFCTANELPCHMFPRDRLPRNCPVFFYCQQSTHTVRAPARLDSMPRFMRWPHKRKMAIG